jgi:hypothetical protein
MPSAEMRATETGAAARARTAETCSPEVAAAAAETGAATEVTATTAKVTAAATDMTATAAEVAAATTTTAVAAATATASLRRGSGTDQKDRENNGQDIEFRHGTLEARGLRREGLIWKPARANRAMVPKFPAVCGLFRGFAESELR